MFDSPLTEDLPGWPTVAPRVILKHSVELEIAGYRDRQETTKLIWLDLPEIRKSLKQGEVRFGSRDLQAPEVDFQFAYRAALEAVKDGAVLMFVDDEQIENLDESLTLRSESRVRYLRLYAQRGL